MAKVTKINIEEFITFLETMRDEEHVEYFDMVVYEKENRIAVRPVIIEILPEKGWTLDEIEKLLD